MKGLARVINSITEGEMEVYRRVVLLVAAMDEGLTCHQVCERLVGDTMIGPHVRHVRGKFMAPSSYGPIPFDHSWLVFVDSPDVIIDPYPWACGSGPFIITAEANSPWRLIYLPSGGLGRSR